MKNKTHFDFYTKVLCSAICVFIAYGVIPVQAAVVQRAAPATTSAPKRATTATKISPALTATVTQNNNDTTVNIFESDDTTTDTSDTTTPDEVIEDKTSQFNTVLNSVASGTTDTSTKKLADLVRAQRAALDNESAAEFETAKTQRASAGISECDSGLRKCMQEKCGKNFIQCATDGDSIWGNKMDACRRNVTCSAKEYSLFTTEIKADRDLNIRMDSYDKILNCGNSYNACIEEQCGATFNKCIGKKAGDAAIEKCKKIANDCTQQDSGLAARTMNVFATLRQNAEQQVKKDEARLYELRDTMRGRCQTLGALFDDRSMDCVFTVEFWAGQPTTSLYASKKAYAGSTFDCNQNWFGVDITTFKENAYRLTREQTSATSALMGAGLGTAAGAITSGAIDRAVDRHKAEKELKKAQNGTDSTSNNTTNTGTTTTTKGGKNKNSNDNTKLTRPDPTPQKFQTGADKATQQMQNDHKLTPLQPANIPGTFDASKAANSVSNLRLSKPTLEYKP